jgi:hypothetical protein
VLDEDVKRGAERERSLMEEVKTLESHVERIQVECLPCGQRPRSGQRGSVPRAEVLDG